MKLEVGMYVRIKKGCICKILRETYSKYLLKNKEFCYEVDKPINANCELYKENISKASHNIIDLIEVGDYVNGYLIDYINLTCETPFLRSERPYRVDNTLYSTLKEKGRDYNQPLHFYNEDIKSIVTKEQFESMEYKII